MQAFATDAAKRSGQSTLVSVQALRFIAAAMVLIGHLEDSLRRGRIEGTDAVVDPTMISWHAGVDIFFIVSGFIMYLTSIDAFGEKDSPQRFLQRRIVRVVPLYWFFTSLMIAVILLMPGKVVHDDLDPGHLIGSYFFIPWPRADGDVQPLLSVGWTLNFEMLFYLAFALALMLPRRAGLTALVGGFIALVLIGQTFPLSWPLGTWCQPIILEFLFGIGIAHLYVRGVRFNGAVRLALIAAGFGLLSLGNVLELKGVVGRWLLWGGPSVLIAAGFILGNDWKAGWLTRALKLGGDASYSLYLSHLFSLRGFGLLWAALGFTSGWGFVAAASVVAIAASIVVYLLIEKPLLSWLRRYLDRPSRPVPRPSLERA